MKNLKTIALAVLVVVSTTAIAQTKKINVATSKISWVGKKVTGQHSGTINFSEGNLIFKKKVLKGGSFTVDMTSIAVTDLKAGEGKEKLEGHLNSADFFAPEKFPTAKIVFKTVTLKEAGIYTITADMTIKNITKPVTFDLTVSEKGAKTEFSVDRTKYDIKYGSGSFFDNLGDKAISNDFDLSIRLAF
jgi:polyisoprenoid-binding protein YceI